MFATTLLHDMRIANLNQGRARSTHNRGGVLDLILVDNHLECGGVQIVKGLGSDHFMVLVSVMIPFISRPQPELGWRYHRALNWPAIEYKLEPFLQVWVNRFRDRMGRMANQGDGARVDWLEGALCVLGVITRGNIWREGSSMGVSSALGDKGGVIVDGWNAKCADTRKKWRQSRGEPHEKMSRRDFMETLTAASSKCWEGRVGEREAMSLQSKRKAHSSIKRVLKPVEYVATVVRVGSEVIHGEEACALWARFFESQTSIDGPRNPESLLADMQVHLRAGNVVGPGSVSSSGDVPCLEDVGVDDDSQQSDFGSGSLSASFCISSGSDSESGTEHEETVADVADGEVPLELGGGGGVPVYTNQSPSHPQSEFDNVYLEHMSERVGHLRSEALERVGLEQQNCFGISELAEAQAKMNGCAATSPLSTLPLQLVMGGSETVRVLLLCILNVMYTWRLIPPSMSTIPIVPVLKPRKQKHRMDHHRQVSLF